MPRKAQQPKEDAFAKAETSAGQIPEVPSRASVYDNGDLSNATQSALFKSKADLFERAYKMNPWVSRGAKMIADSVAAGGFKVQPLNPKADVDEQAQEYLERTLAQPNRKQTFTALNRQIALDLMVFGNGYVEVGRFSSAVAKSNRPRLNDTFSKAFASQFSNALDITFDNLDGLPVSLYRVHPGGITIETKQNGEVINYYQHRNTPNEVKFAPEQIIHFALPGVSSDVYGESPLEALENDLALDLMLQTYFRAQLENGSKIGIIANVEEMPEEEKAKLEKWLNSKIRGPLNANRNLVLSAKKAALQSGPKVDYDDAGSLSDRNKEKILTCYGIPPTRFGTIDSGGMNSQNQDGTNKSYVESTVKPLARYIESKWNTDLISDFRVVGINGYGVVLETEDVDLIQTRADTLIKLQHAGDLTANEVRIELRKPPHDAAVIDKAKDEGRIGDVPLVLTSSGLIGLEDAEQMDTQAVGAKLDAFNGATGGSTPVQKSNAQDRTAARDREPAGAGSSVTEGDFEKTSLVNARVSKTLGKLANELLRVLNEGQ